MEPDVEPDELRTLRVLPDGLQDEAERRADDEVEADQ